MLYTVCLLPQWTPSQSGLCLLKSTNEFKQNMYDNCKGCIAGWSNKHNYVTEHIQPCTK